LPECYRPDRPGSQRPTVDRQRPRETGRGAARARSERDPSTIGGPGTLRAVVRPRSSGTPGR